MNESQVEFVEPEGLTINIPSIGAPMAIRAEGDEIVVGVRLTFRPRDNVMDIDFDVSTDGDSAAVARLNQDSPAEFSRYWRTPVVSHQESPQDANDNLSRATSP